ncbi:MAG TPA: nucleotidyltransferase domain-containing protein, partial [Ktedonobacterales bacterium]
MQQDESLFLSRIVDAIATVPGITAIVLGGSRASGTHTPTSDYDIGLYYDGGAPFDLATLRQVVRNLDDQRRGDAVTPLGGWGAWINGGGWLTIEGQAVDLIYRDEARVAHIVDEVPRGHFESFYHWGHPHAFISTIYAAEIALCHPLRDPNGHIAALKGRLQPYPPRLRQRMATDFLYGAEFLYNVGLHGLPRGDSNYTAGCCFRAITCLAQSLCALNERWVMNEKGVVALAAHLPLTIDDFDGHVATIYARLPQGADGPVAALTMLGDVIAQGRTIVETHLPD